MRDVTLKEHSVVAGGVWCTWDGRICSGCANLTWVEGSDCGTTTSSTQFYMPNASMFKSSAVGGAIGAALACIPGGPFGMAAGAMAGAALAIFGVVLYDAYELNKTIKD